MLIILLISLFVLIILVIAFINIRLSFALYVAYLILVPYMKVAIGGFSLSYSVVELSLFVGFLVFFYKGKGRKLNYLVIAPFVFLYTSLLIISVFSTDGPDWMWQVNAWRTEFIPILILSIVLWNLILADHRTLNYLKFAIIGSCIIAGVYGVYLTHLGGQNPYIMTLSKYYGFRDDAEIFSEMFGDSRLGLSTASKIQSTMIHPMTWGLICCFNLFILSVYYFKGKVKLVGALIGLVIFNILTSGVRTAIAATVLGVFFLILRQGKVKLLLIAIIVSIILYFIIISNKDLTNFFVSFIDVSGRKSDVGGSSIVMRLDQLQGALDEIKGHELFGKGFQWSGYYMQKHTVHPVLLAFESLIFVVLCNSGFVGMMLWIFFFWYLLYTNRRGLTDKSNIYVMDSFVIMFIAYCVGTGEYNYMKYFTLYYIFLFGSFIKYEESWSQSVLKVSKSGNMVKSRD